MKSGTFSLGKQKCQFLVSANCEDVGGKKISNRNTVSSKMTLIDTPSEHPRGIQWVVFSDQLISDLIIWYDMATPSTSPRKGSDDALFHDETTTTKPNFYLF